ncbi:lipid II flippase Amj family protein [Paenibacillus humicus]
MAVSSFLSSRQQQIASGYRQVKDRDDLPEVLLLIAQVAAVSLFTMLIHLAETLTYSLRLAGVRLRGFAGLGTDQRHGDDHARPSDRSEDRLADRPGHA